MMAEFGRRSILSSREGLLAAFLAALVIWWPLPFGSVTPISLLVMRVSAGLALGIAVAAGLGRSSIRRLGVAVIGLLGVAALALAQSLPWPVSLARLVSAEHVALAGDGAEIGLGAVRLSLAPSATLSVAVSTLALAALLIAALAAGAHTTHRRLLGAAVLVSALTQVVIGLKPWLAGSKPRLTGSFVNPDHLALQLEVALCVGLVMIVGLFRRLRRTAGVDVLSLALAASGGLWMTLLFGLLATGSRAGLVAAGAGLALAVGLVLSVVGRSRAMLTAIGAGLTAVAIFVISARDLALGSVGRLLSSSWHDVSRGGRLEVWKQASGLVKDYPLVGTGLGTFEEAYPLVQGADSSRILFGRAHNDFIELLVTGGAMGIVLASVVVAGVVLPLSRVLRRGLRTEDRLAAVAALSALAAAATHELFDFGASLPSNAAIITVLCGVASAARLREQDEPPPGESAAFPAARAPGG